MNPAAAEGEPKSRPAYRQRDTGLAEIEIHPAGNERDAALEPKIHGSQASLAPATRDDRLSGRGRSRNTSSAVSQ